MLPARRRRAPAGPGRLPPGRTRADPPRPRGRPDARPRLARTPSAPCRAAKPPGPTSPPGRSRRWRHRRPARRRAPPAPRSAAADRSRGARARGSPGAPRSMCRPRAAQARRGGCAAPAGRRWPAWPRARPPRAPRRRQGARSSLPRAAPVPSPLPATRARRRGRRRRPTIGSRRARELPRLPRLARDPRLLGRRQAQRTGTARGDAHEGLTGRLGIAGGPGPGEPRQRRRHPEVVPARDAVDERQRGQRRPRGRLLRPPSRNAPGPARAFVVAAPEGRRSVARRRPSRVSTSTPREAQPSIICAASGAPAMAAVDLVERRLFGPPSATARRRLRGGAPPPARRRPVAVAAWAARRAAAS